MTAPHWEAAYLGKDLHSWDQDVPGVDLRQLEASGMRTTHSVIDVGGGNGAFAQALLDRGHRDITVLDISEHALAAGRRRLDSTSDAVSWLAVDLTKAWEPQRTYDVWHDRATFHFMTTKETRSAYRRALTAATHVGSLICVGTFAADGPTSCSGLPVERYNPSQLVAALSTDTPQCKVVAQDAELHRTPFNTDQPFTWVTLLRTR